MAEIHPFIGRALRYGLVGLVNTLIGLSVITALDLGVHLRPELANAAGYAVGLLLSFVLARRFVYRNKEAVKATGPRYVLVVATGLLINQVVLHFLLRLFAPGALEHAAAQLCAVAVYTAFVFVICNVWVFRSANTAA